jgi:hypothetical protein
MAAVPVWVVFVGTTLTVIVMLELGYRLGRRTHRRSPKEKESPVGAYAAAMLGLLAFMLGFTFNLVAERYQTRRSTVREEVNALQTAYLRSELLPQPDRDDAKELLAAYVAEIVETRRRPDQDTASVKNALALGNRWHRELWSVAIANARRDLDSDIGALYVESINKVFEVRADRAMLDTSKVQLPIWFAMYGLTFLGVLGVSYQSGIAGSKRSKAGVFLAMSFALVISLIADLDRVAGYITISHKPFEELQESIASIRQAAR